MILEVKLEKQINLFKGLSEAKTLCNGFIFYHNNCKVLFKYIIFASCCMHFDVMFWRRTLPVAQQL